MRLLRILPPTSVGNVFLCFILSALTLVTDNSTVSTATKTYFQTILADTSTNYLASVATYVSFALTIVWNPLTQSQADTYRYTDAGLFSQPFHYIDANDNPPSSCGVDYNRDCGTGGCIVSAIQNYVGV